MFIECRRIGEFQMSMINYGLTDEYLVQRLFSNTIWQSLLHSNAVWTRKYATARMIDNFLRD